MKQREIKFRAWDKERKIMDYTDKDLRCDFSDGDVYVVNSQGDFEDYELMQFTGLHDKNGKEIFEGDLLKSSWPNPSRVMFVDYGFKKCFWDYANDRWIPEPLGENEEEIMGNIYDNPELLEETK